MRLTRVYKFSASHRLHAPSLDEQTRIRTFTVNATTRYGHGHNYVRARVRSGVHGRCYRPRG